MSELLRSSRNWKGPSAAANFSSRRRDRSDCHVNQFVAKDMQQPEVIWEATFLPPRFRLGHPRDRHHHEVHCPT